MQTRYLIIMMIFLSTYINYAVRVNISISIISMIKVSPKHTPDCAEYKEESKNKSNKTIIPPDYGPRYDWDEYTQGFILGAYFWTFVIFSIPAGRISEYYGPVKVILITILCSSLLNSLCVPAASLHYGVLFFCRLLMGAFGSTTYPSLQVLIAKWAPPDEKGKFVSALMGNTLSTTITWPLVGAVTSHWGWSWGFHVQSLQLIVFCILFFFLVTDSPYNNRYISSEEQNFIRRAQGSSVAVGSSKPPYMQIIISRPFWMLNVLNFGNMWGLYIQLQIVPKLMAEVMGFNLNQSGILGAVPHLTRLLCGLGFGAVGDFLIQKKIMSKNAIRKSFVVPSHLLPGILMCFMCLSGCNWIPLVILLTVSMGFTGAAVLTNLVNPQDLAPNFAGTVYGIMNLIGGTPGFIVPAVHAVIISEHNGIKEWCTTSLIGGGILIGSGIIFILFGTVQEQEWNRQ